MVRIALQYTGFGFRYLKYGQGNLAVLSDYILFSKQENHLPPFPKGGGWFQNVPLFIRNS